MYHLTILGPKLPCPIEKSAMVTAPDGCGLILIGGCYENGSFSKDIFQLRGQTFQTLEWVKLDQTLKYPRRNHLAFYVPHDFTFSTEENQPLHKQMAKTDKTTSKKQECVIF